MTPIESDRDSATMADLLAGVERALRQVQTPELREDLLDIAAIYRAALDGYRVAGPGMRSTRASTDGA